jgi:hypothetical protein
MKKCPLGISHPILLILCTLLYTTLTTTSHCEETAPLLTWTKDPCTTACITWISEEKNSLPLHWREKKNQENAWEKKESHPTPLTHEPKTIHRAQLQHLSPNTPYEIKIEGKTHHFKTLPDTLEEPLVIVAGGDTMESKKEMEEIQQLLPKLNPHFVLLGGDLAYDDGNPKKLWRWEQWLKTLQRFPPPDGRLLPIVTCIGNHETAHGFLDRSPNQENPAPLFDALFQQPPYFSLKIGKNLEIILLDSAHTTPIDGEQLAWLKTTLTQRQNPPPLYTLCIYHVPAYPSVRNPNNPTNAAIRKNWVPVFESAKVDLCLEHHDHAYKRTHPLLQNQPNPNGITYIGDGCWGVQPRQPSPQPYLLKTLPQKHLLKITLEKTHLQVEAITPSGDVIDTFEKKPNKRLDSPK